MDIIVKDELGTHVISQDDCVYKCNKCGGELDVRQEDIVKGRVILEHQCSCGGTLGFRYWLDGVYTEEEYNELERKFRMEK